MAWAPSVTKTADEEAVDREAEEGKGGEELQEQEEVKEETKEGVNGGPAAKEEVGGSEPVRGSEGDTPVKKEEQEGQGGQPQGGFAGSPSGGGNTDSIETKVTRFPPLHFPLFLLRSSCSIPAVPTSRAKSAGNRDGGFVFSPGGITDVEWLGRR